MDRRTLLLLVGLIMGQKTGVGAGLAMSIDPEPGPDSTSDLTAIKGYDPVAYFTERRPIPGDPQYQYDWDGAVYRFSSARHLEIFKADPDRYLPQFRNLCTIQLSRGKKLAADPNYWIIHEGRLYLFSGPEGPALLLADPVGVTARARESYEAISRLPDPPQ